MYLSFTIIFFFHYHIFSLLISLLTLRIFSTQTFHMHYQLPSSSFTLSLTYSSFIKLLFSQPVIYESPSLFSLNILSNYPELLTSNIITEWFEMSRPRPISFSTSSTYFSIFLYRNKIYHSILISSRPTVLMYIFVPWNVYYRRVASFWHKCLHSPFILIFTWTSKSFIYLANILSQAHPCRPLIIHDLYLLTILSITIPKSF